MSQDKIDDFFRSELEQRRIQPSAQSWEKLQERLHANTENFQSKSNNTYYKLALAIALLITTGSVFMVFLVNKTKAHNFRNNEIVSQIKPKNVLVTENNKVLSAETNSLYKLAIRKQSENKELPLNATIKNINEQNSSVVGKVEKDEVLQNKKVQELIAQVVKKHASADEITDDEVNTLLKQAQQEIYAQRVASVSDSTISMNALALLMDVEDELDTSFKDKILNAIKAGYLKVKTAVAERNQ
ncbi:hypothetical protein ACG2LH_08260 [Zhouia sp. PK063]|uniref:hypothetical protein n=1 Tax=Zhouia sp. PK063 TaxID=3373602 RepID=UPI00378C93EB